METQDQITQLQEQVAALTAQVDALKRFFFWEDVDLTQRTPTHVYVPTLIVQDGTGESDGNAEIKLEVNDREASIVLMSPGEAAHLTLNAAGEGDESEAGIRIYGQRDEQTERRVEIGHDLKGGQVKVFGEGDQPWSFQMTEEQRKTQERPTNALRGMLSGSDTGGTLLLCTNGPDGQPLGRVWLQCDPEQAKLALSPGGDRTHLQVMSVKEGGQFMATNGKGEVVVVGGSLDGQGMFEVRRGNSTKVRISEQNGGGLVMLNSAKGTQAFGALSTENGGMMAIFGADGERRISLDAGEEGGELEVATGSGLAEVSLSASENGGSTVWRRNEMQMAALAPLVNEESDDAAMQFVLHAGEHGAPSHVLGPGAMLGLMGTDGLPRMMLMGHARGGRIDLLEVGDESSTNRLSLDVDEAGNGRLDVWTGDGQTALSMMGGEDGGQLTLWGRENHPGVRVEAAQEGGRVQVMQQNGELAAQMLAREEGGGLDFFNAQGELETSLPQTP